MTVPVHKIGAKEREMPPADYVGQAVEPLYNREDVRDEDLPWFQASQISNGAPLERYGSIPCTRLQMVLTSAKTSC